MNGTGTGTPGHIPTEDTMIDTATATAAVTQAKTHGVDLTVTLVDGTTHTGTPVSVNSKGVNLKIDGKVRSFGLSRVTGLATPGASDTDGMTTREVAALFDIEAKKLRVYLRTLGLNVGKGKRYTLTTADVATLRDHINANA